MNALPREVKRSQAQSHQHKLEDVLILLRFDAVLFRYYEEKKSLR